VSTTARKVFAVIGTTDEVTQCELCGRPELKGTIVLDVLDEDGNRTGELVYYGASCGAKAAGWTTREVQRAAKAADTAQRDEERRQRDEELQKWCAARDAWIAENVGPDALSNPRKYGYRGTVMLRGRISASDWRLIEPNGTALTIFA